MEGHNLEEYSGELLSMAPFDSDGSITSRTRVGIENILNVYSKFSNSEAKYNKVNANKYRIRDVYIVGSAVRNKIDSDLDVLLIAPKLNETQSNKLRLNLSECFFCNRPKQESLDVFINESPIGESINVTSQVKDLLKEYNPISSNRD